MIERHIRPDLRCPPACTHPTCTLMCWKCVKTAACLSNFSFHTLMQEHACSKQYLGKTQPKQVHINKYLFSSQGYFLSLLRNKCIHFFTWNYWIIRQWFCVIKLTWTVWMLYMYKWIQYHRVCNTESLNNDYQMCSIPSL